MQLVRTATSSTALQASSSGAAGAGGPAVVPDAFLIELMLRHFSRMGELRLYEISQRLGLNATKVDALLGHMRALQQVEIPRRGAIEGDVSYTLTGEGQKQAKLALEKCGYVGYAPVTLEEYTRMVTAQSLRLHPTSAAGLKNAVGNMVIDEAMLPTLGSALNSGQAIYLHGPSGSGKTYLAEHLVKTLHGQIWVPHAVYVDGEVILVFDPMVHRRVEASSSQERMLDGDGMPDGRWVRTERPVVITGGELTLQMLDLEFDRVSRFYVAPPQMKANNGIFVVDDFGRQRVSPRDLLNRWIVPMDRHVDYLALHTGSKFQIPFDMTVIFSSNMPPEELTDAAFSRRLGYKIPIGALNKQGYGQVIAQACARLGLEFDADVVDFMIDHLHPSYEQEYLPCIPYDVLSKIRDRALYLGQPARLSRELIEWAWKIYFGAGGRPAQPAVSTPGNEEREK